MFGEIYEKKMIAVNYLVQLKLFDLALNLIQDSPHLALFHLKDINLLNCIYRATESCGRLTGSEEVKLLELLYTASSLNVLGFKIQDSDHPYAHLFLLAGFEFENAELTQMREELIHLGSAFIKREITNELLESSLLYSSFGLKHKVLLDGFKICEFKKQFVMKLAQNNESEKEYSLF